MLDTKQRRGITQASVIQAMLECIGLSARPPPLAPARGPWQEELAFEDTCRRPRVKRNERRRRALVRLAPWQRGGRWSRESWSASACRLGRRRSRRPEGLGRRSWSSRAPEGGFARSAVSAAEGPSCVRPLGRVGCGPVGCAGRALAKSDHARTRELGRGSDSAQPPQRGVMTRERGPAELPVRDSMFTSFSPLPITHSLCRAIE